MRPGLCIPANQIISLQFVEKIMVDFSVIFSTYLETLFYDQRDFKIKSLLLMFESFYIFSMNSTKYVDSIF